MNRMNTIRLPCFGIAIRLTKRNTTNSPGGGCITSDLHTTKTTTNQQYNGAIDGLEALILAHACAGIDVRTPVYVEGIETAVEAITNQFS